MLVKCKICGNKVDRLQAYKVVVNGRNNYYCNETEYKQWIYEKEIKDNTYLLIYDIFGRKVTNTILFKEVNDLANIYTYKKIFAYLKENEQYLNHVMQKSFTNEYAQIRYFSAILKNSMNDFKYHQEPIKEIDIDMPECKFSRKKQRRTLEEYEAEDGDEV